MQTLTTILIALFNLGLSGLSIILLEADFLDSAGKWTQLLVFIVVALGVIMSAIYSIFRGVKIKDLQAKITTLREDNAELVTKVAAEKADKVLIIARNARLELKLKDERKITLSQAAIIQGIPLPVDHYEDDCDV